MWSSTSSSSSNRQKPSKTPPNSPFNDFLNPYLNDILKNPTQLALSTFALGVASTIAASTIRKRYFHRLKTVDWVTPDVLEKRRWIKGVVTTVGDADNFRLYHTPGPFWRFPLPLRRVPTLTRDLKDQTLHIRMAGVDAPEAAHFGRPAQQYANEALTWLRQQIEGKVLYCQLIHRDQYGRLVAITHLPLPYLPPSLTPALNSKHTCLSLSMVRAGWGVTYELSGAEYGKWGKEEFVKMEEEARAVKRGIWEHGRLVETPSEYKKRFAASSSSSSSSSDTADDTSIEEDVAAGKKRKKGWLSWLGW